jgi:uncharacterized protein RhaS with RHS repeats
MKKLLAITFALSLFATIASANDSHGGSPFPGPAFGGPEGGGLIVASDGSVFLVTTTVSSGVASTTIKAVRSSGTVAWTSTISGRGHLELSGNNLLSVSETEAADRTVTSTITAISTLTGATAWTRSLGGRIAELTPFSGGTYAVTVVPPATSGGTATRSLVAIGNDGSILWTLAL